MNSRHLIVYFQNLLSQKNIQPAKLKLNVNAYSQNIRVEKDLNGHLSPIFIGKIVLKCQCIILAIYLFNFLTFFFFKPHCLQISQLLTAIPYQESYNSFWISPICHFLCIVSCYELSEVRFLCLVTVSDIQIFSLQMSITFTRIYAAI